MPEPNTKCHICLVPIYRIPCRLSDHNVCSYSCRNKYFSKERSFVWKGGDYKYNGRKLEKARRLDYKKRAMELFGNSCLLCGFTGCAASFDFHHLDPSKKESDMKSLSYRSWDKVEAELSKCVLLCSNCHREHHWKERNEADTYSNPLLTRRKI
jgi:hypothetical protein